MFVYVCAILGPVKPPKTSHCLKCGEQGQPQPAVGLDEDGEAACIMHSVKAQIPEENTDMANEPKLCACGCGTELPEGYKWPRLRGHAGQGNGSQRNGSHRKSSASKSTPKAPVSAAEAMVTLRLPAAKVEKLFSLLLQ